MNIYRKWENGLILIEPNIIKDARGYFTESFNTETFKELTGIDVKFVQDNESKSAYGTVRGLHFQKPPHAQSKLVRVTNGAVIDFVVDIRRGSPTYGQCYKFYLSDKNHRQLFIPKGFAHGFISLSDDTVFQYKCDEFYHPESEGGIDWLFDTDRFIANEYINKDDIKASPKDMMYPSFDEFDTPFEYEGENNTIDEQNGFSE